MASSSSTAQPQAAASSTKWQDTLNAACQDRKLRPPTWQMYSDRRGGRTAWTCAVTVGGESIQARNWYDGSYVNNAKEDAAELALRRLGVVQSQPQQPQQQQQQQAQQPQAVAGQQQPPATSQSPQQGGSGWF